MCGLTVAVPAINASLQKAAVGAKLEDDEKRMIIRAAHGVAMADGEVCERELKLLSDVAEAIELTEDEYRKILTGFDGLDWPG